MITSCCDQTFSLTFGLSRLKVTAGSMVSVLPTTISHYVQMSMNKTIQTLLKLYKIEIFNGKMIFSSFCSGRRGSYNDYLQSIFWIKIRIIVYPCTV